MKTKNITVKKYLSLDNTSSIDLYYNLIKPKNVIKGHEATFNGLTFNEVSVIKRYANKTNIESLQIIIDIFYNFDDNSKINLLECSIYELFQFRKWLSNELLKIYTNEKKLESTPNVKLIAANVDRLNQFGELNTKIDLGEQFGFRPKDIGQWLYVEVFQIMHRNKVKGDIQKDIK